MRSHTPPALPVMSHTLETPALASPLVILTSGCSATAADTLHIIHHQCWYVYTDTSPCCSRVKETFCPQLRGEEEVPVRVNQLYSNLFQYTYLPCSTCKNLALPVSTKTTSRTNTHHLNYSEEHLPWDGKPRQRYPRGDKLPG